MDGRESVEDEDEKSVGEDGEGDAGDAGETEELLVVLLEKMTVKPKLVMKKVKVKKMVMMTLMMILVMSGLDEDDAKTDSGEGEVNSDIGGTDSTGGGKVPVKTDTDSNNAIDKLRDANAEDPHLWSGLLLFLKT